MGKGEFEQRGSGGSFGGQDTFALTITATNLVPGPDYALSVRDLGSSPELPQARARIVVEGDYTVSLNQVLYRLIGGAALLIVCALWAVAVLFLRRRRPAK